MLSPGALVFAALLAAMTWVSPLLSVYIFVLCSPFGAFNDVLGWDPRTRWALVLCLRGVWEAWRTGRNYVPSPVWKIWAGFTLLAVGGLWIGNRGLAADELEASRTLLLYFVAGSCGVYGIWQLVRSKQQLRVMSAVFAASVLIASAMGIVQAQVQYRLGDPSNRITGPLGNPNYFATYLALAATTLVLLVRLNLIKRWYGFIACAAAMVACGFTLSRTGIMAILVGVSLASIVRSEKKLLSTRVIVVAGITVVLASALLTTYVLGYRRSLTYSDRAGQEQIAESMQAAEDLSRLEAFRYSLQLTAEYPLAGVGFGTFQARNYEANGLYVTTHNTVMQVLVGTGLVGGILMLSLIIFLVMPLHPHARKYIFPAAVAFGMCSLFGDYLQSIEVFVIFALLYLSVRTLVPGSPANSDQKGPPCAV